MRHSNLLRSVRAAVVAMSLVFGVSGVATAQVRFGVGVGIGLPGVRIGISVPTYPLLVPVPGYPVYYAPRLAMNLFFYDGLYWVYTDDNWYSSSWYDGPWYLVAPEMVPDFILRIPVRYYRRPPAYFLHWNRAAPPRWGEHWGRAWERRRGDWNRWDRRVVPRRAPLPRYQHQYPRERYPNVERQRTLENRYYRYRPRNEQRARPQAPQRERSAAPPRERSTAPRGERDRAHDRGEGRRGRERGNGPPN